MGGLEQYFWHISYMGWMLKTIKSHTHTRHTSYIFKKKKEKKIQGTEINGKQKIVIGIEGPRQCVGRNYFELQNASVVALNGG